MNDKINEQIEFLYKHFFDTNEWANPENSLERRPELRTLLNDNTDLTHKTLVAVQDIAFDINRQYDSYSRRVDPEGVQKEVNTQIIQAQKSIVAEAFAPLLQKKEIGSNAVHRTNQANGQSFKGKTPSPLMQSVENIRKAVSQFIGRG